MDDALARIVYAEAGSYLVVLILVVMDDALAPEINNF